MMMNRIVPNDGAAPFAASVPTELPSPAFIHEERGIDLTNHQFKKQQTVSLVTRKCKAAQIIHRFISYTAYKISSVLAVFLALFLTDFTRCALSPDSDKGMEIVNLLIFFFLLSDVILQSIAYPRYICSMFFWLDFIGTLTLLADMDLALSLVGQSYSDLTVARGGRAGRAARSAGSLRLGRIVMWARIGRVVRVARVMRVARLINDENNNRLQRERRQLMRMFNNEVEKKDSISDSGVSAEHDAPLLDHDIPSDTGKISEMSTVKRKNSMTESKVSLGSGFSSIPSMTVDPEHLANRRQSSCTIARKVLDENDTENDTDHDSDSVADSHTSHRSMRGHMGRNTRMLNMATEDDPDEIPEEELETGSLPQSMGRQQSLQTPEEVVKEKVYRKTQSSKIGISVADNITRDVVFGILLTIGLTPLFNGTLEESYSAYWSAGEWLEYCIESDTITTNSMSEYVDVFLLEHPDVVSFRVNDTFYEQDESRMNALRDTEMRWFESSNTEIILDCHGDVRFAHGMNIGFTIVIVFLFAGLAFLITRTVSNLVVHPIERMTRIIQEFTKRIVFLGGDMEDQAKVVESLMETTVIEAAVATLTNIFNAITNVSDQQTGAPTHLPVMVNQSNNLDASPVMTHSGSERSTPERPFRGNKSYMSALPKAEARTSIRTRDSVITFNITEKKRVYVSEEEIQKRLEQIRNSGELSSFCVTVQRFPELKSVSTVMCHPIACEYFRSYCASAQSLENYTFVRSVQNFHEEIRKKFCEVWTNYFADGAPNQITVQASKRRNLWEQYEKNSFSVTVFDDFRQTILDSMQTSIFSQFVESEWGIAYATCHKELGRRYSHLDLASYDRHRPPSPDIASLKNHQLTPHRVAAIAEE